MRIIPIPAELGVINPRNEAPDNHEASFVPMPMPMIAAEYGVANEHGPRPWGEIKKSYTHFIETGISRMTGTEGQKRVPTDYFTRSPFPLSPLAEQHRIVAKVIELMALCVRLEASLTIAVNTGQRLARCPAARGARTYG